MKLKGSKKITCHVICCLILFLGVFMPSKIVAFPQVDDSNDSISETSDPDRGEPSEEKRKVNYTATCVIFTLIVAVLSYGYYKERKNQ